MLCPAAMTVADCRPGARERVRTPSLSCDASSILPMLLECAHEGSEAIFTTRDASALFRFGQVANGQQEGFVCSMRYRPLRGEFASFKGRATCHGSARTRRGPRTVAPAAVTASRTRCGRGAVRQRGYPTARENVTWDQRRTSCAYGYGWLSVSRSFLRGSA
jgi:hypothetical protein